MKRMSYYIIGLLLSLMSWSCSDDAETGREEIPVETDGGYLFAHMTNANYGKLYYAVSRDGINWETLNKGRIINSAYIGHPDICQGHDGAFYMIAVNPLALWRSENLVTWTSTQLNEMIFNRSNAQGFYTTYYWGAPKMFYDKDSDFSLPAGLRAACKATVMTPKPNDKMLSYAQSLDKADAPPEDMALGSYFAQKVTLTCQ